MKSAKKVLTMVLLLSMVFGCMSVSKLASAKSVSKISKVFTLTRKNGVTHKLSIKKNEKVYVKMEFLDVKGKVSPKVPASGVELGNATSDWWEPLFGSDSTPKLTKSSFKKGAKFTSNSYLYGKEEIEWCFPEGPKKLKVKVTYYTKSGKAGIKFQKQKYFH